MLDSPADDFAIRCERTGTTLRMIVRGELDLATAPELRACWADEREGGAEIVLLDLSSVTFMDSSGLRAVIDFHGEDPKRLRVIVSHPVRRVIELAGMHDTLPIVTD